MASVDDILWMASFGDQLMGVFLLRRLELCQVQRTCLKSSFFWRTRPAKWLLDSSAEPAVRVGEPLGQARKITLKGMPLEDAHS